MVMRQRVRRLAVLLIVVGFLSACSAPTDPRASSEPSAAVTPDSTLSAEVTFDEIAAKFPSESELAAEYQTAQICASETAGSDTCGQIRMGKSRYVNGFNALDEAASIPAAVIFSLVEISDATERDTYVDSIQADDEERAGDFDRAPEGDRAGERGSGTYADYTWGEWSGTRLDSTVESYGHDGVAVTAPLSTSSVVLVRGSLVLLLRIYMEQLPQGESKSVEMDRALASVLEAE